ncbi:YjgP/YjgQ family permease [Prolixibacteraceae bacterium JC049]|nr:YjgP/YjgQ family permease [Prolixibacteraceae bacterium JC049]
MKRLHWFIIRSFLGPFFMTLFICIFVLMMQLLWQKLDDIVGKGLDTMVIAELFGYMVLSIIPLALPLSVLLASLMAFGNMGENYELTAIKAAGISLTRAMRPLIIFSVSLAVAAFCFSNFVLPVVNTKMYTLLWSIQRKNPEVAIQEGIFTYDFDDFVIKVNDVDNDNGMLRDIMIYDHSGRSSTYNNVVIVADSGRIEMTKDMRNMQMTLYSGERYSDMPKDYKRPNNHPFQRDKFSKQVIINELNGFDLERMDEKHARSLYKMLSLRHLEVKKDSLDSVLNKRVERFVTRMNFNSQMTKHLFNAIRPDTVQLEVRDITSDSIAVHNMDSIYLAYSDENKLQILESSLQSARNNEGEISRKMIDFYNSQKIIYKHDIEWHKKITLSLACLIFFFIGAPLGAIIRKGGLGMPVVVSVFLFIFYHIISTTGEKFGREGSWILWQAVWMSTSIFAPVGVFLTYKAANDSSLMSSEAYLDFFKKLNIFKKKKKEEPKESV